jgi:hypothetical protein
LSELIGPTLCEELLTVFGAKSWLVANYAEAQALTPETLQAVSSFTLMWNLFESTVCDNEAKVSTFERLAEAIANGGQLPDEISEGLHFWTARYWTGTEFNYLFAGLEFRGRDREELVRAVLSGAQIDARSKVLAAMIIVYRLRNNLFHGLKTIAMLNDQVFNLDMACRTLAGILGAPAFGK